MVYNGAECYILVCLRLEIMMVETQTIFMFRKAVEMQNNTVVNRSSRNLQSSSEPRTEEATLEGDLDAGYFRLFGSRLFADPFGHSLCCSANVPTRNN